MTENNQTVRIFMMPQQFPCGPRSSCCGPIGQSEEEITNLKNAIEKELGFKTEVVNVIQDKDLKNHSGVVRLIQSFGAMVLPIITIGDDDEVVSMGVPTPAEAISAIKEKIES
ncbi:MAG: hypothetical protein ABDK94_10680 [Atribacterota bacterium]